MCAVAGVRARGLTSSLPLFFYQNKSFVESGGTVLSTNWGEVGSKTVEGTPPAGLEMKKWSDVSKKGI